MNFGRSLKNTMSITTNDMYGIDGKTIIGNDLPPLQGWLEVGAPINTVPIIIGSPVLML